MPKHQEYRGKRRNRRTTVDVPLVPLHTCSNCGKQAYMSRSDAKLWAKRLHQGKKVRYYLCRGRNTESYWHVTTEGALETAAYKDYEWDGEPA